MSALSDWFSKQTTSIQNDLANLGNGSPGTANPTATVMSAANQSSTGKGSLSSLSNLTSPLSGLLSFSGDVMLGALGILLIIAGVWRLAK